MILDGALCDSQLYISTLWRDRISTLSFVIQKFLRESLLIGDYYSPQYRNICEIVSRQFTCRREPRPQCYYDSLKYANKEISTKFLGPCEFAVSLNCLFIVNNTYITIGSDVLFMSPSL